MSAITTVKHFTSNKYLHTFTLVFADRVRTTEGGYWQNRKPGGWVEDLHNPDLLGVVLHPSHPSHPKFGITVDRPDGRGASYGSLDTLEEAVQEVRTRHAEIVSDIARREADPSYALEQEMRCHDWYYHFSDDGGVYRAGQAHWNQIATLIKQVPAETVKTFWAAYAPEDTTCPV